MHVGVVTKELPLSNALQGYYSLNSGFAHVTQTGDNDYHLLSFDANQYNTNWNVGGNLSGNLYSLHVLFNGSAGDTGIFVYAIYTKIQVASIGDRFGPGVS
jgi:hypothetical protein